MPEFTWLPANQAAPEDVDAVFGSGGARKCRCQAMKVPGWIWRDTTQEQGDAALREQAGCGTTGPTSGLIRYDDGEAAGWVAVEPREHDPRLWSRKQAWMRTDAELEGVWSRSHDRDGPQRGGLTLLMPSCVAVDSRCGGCAFLPGHRARQATVGL
jgi:hypothetical protein